MKTHPARLLILVPEYEQQAYRRSLTAIDDALVVHHQHRDWRFDLRPRVEFTTGKRPGGYGAALLRLAADLEAGYTVMLVEPRRFLDDLEQAARQHASAKDLPEIERAVLVIARHAAFRIVDLLATPDRQTRANRSILAGRKRDVRPRRGEPDGLNVQRGLPVPRAELFWHTVRYETVDAAEAARAREAWSRWCHRNRPSLPRVAA